MRFHCKPLRQTLRLRWRYRSVSLELVNADNDRRYCPILWNWQFICAILMELLAHIIIEILVIGGRNIIIML